MLDNPDFSCYVPIAGSSTNGYVNINHETAPGGATVLDVNYNNMTKLWSISHSQAADLAAINGLTAANCSGGLTPWGTVLSGEEYVYTSDFNADGYNDIGWIVEFDPVTRKAIRKLWALGCVAHENAAVKSDGTTIYFGADNNDFGYVYKFVCTTANDPTSGTLYALHSLLCVDEKGEPAVFDERLRGGAGSAQLLALDPPRVGQLSHGLVDRGEPGVIEKPDQRSGHDQGGQELDHEEPGEPSGGKGGRAAPGERLPGAKPPVWHGQEAKKPPARRDVLRRAGHGNERAGRSGRRLRRRRRAVRRGWTVRGHGLRVVALRSRSGLAARSRPWPIP